MRSIYGFAAAALMMGSGSLAASPMPDIKILPTAQPFTKGTKRMKTGKTYPHSSKRQCARYARQIAAGQI